MKKYYKAKKCSLCGKKANLTFEHIPPRGAFNSTPTKPVSGFNLLGNNKLPWDLNGLPYRNQQRGMGKFSLCLECNNNTGAWYASEYIKLSKTIDSIFQKKEYQIHEILELENVYPQRIIKQVLSMFCSINDISDSRFDYLRKFVRERDQVGIDKSKYRICIYFTESKLMKYNPLSGLFSLNNNSSITILSEITAYPLGFILYFDPKETDHFDGVDITDFGNCEYNTQYTVKIPLSECIKEMNDIIPGYYRTKDEIIKCIKDNTENDS